MMSAPVIVPVTPERWADLEILFGPKGAMAGCWCMWWRQTRREFEAQHGEQNRLAMRAIVERGDVPGLLAYMGGVPAGWVSVAPRPAFASLQRSRTLKPVDDTAAWAIVCFFIGKEHRGQGLMRTLIEAACDYARSQGAPAIEAFPEDQAGERTVPDAFSAAFMGSRRAFEAAGFVEVARRGRQPVMRRAL